MILKKSMQILKKETYMEARLVKVWGKEKINCYWNNTSVFSFGKSNIYIIKCEKIRKEKSFKRYVKFF